MSPADLAREHGLDPAAMEGLVAFLRANLPAEFASLSSDAQSALIELGVREWHKRSTLILSELAAGETDWAKESRRVLAEQVWHAAREQAGLQH